MRIGKGLKGVWVNYLRALRKQIVLDRVLHELGVVLEAHLREQARAMRRHGLHAHVEIRRDLAGRLARGDETENLELAVGQPRVRLVLRRLHEIERERLGECRREESLAPRDLPNRGHEMLARGER